MNRSVRVAAKFINEQPCHIENCQNNARTRGLCHKHYVYYLRKVTREEISWEELEAQGISLPPTALDSPSFRYDQLCLTPNCGKPARLRGLCRSCYSRMDYWVRSGRHTWEELEAQGFSQPKVIKYPDLKADDPNFQYEAYQETGVSELTWEDREFLTAINYQQSMNQFSEELFNKAYQLGWIEKENGQWWLSDLGAKMIENFNRNLFADTDYPLSDY